MFISKSFKELFFMAFFEKADAKVRLIFEPPKLFGRNFQKKVFLEVAGSRPHPFSAFQLYRVSLSKAGAKVLLYNISAKYFQHFFPYFL